jgi:gamma-glutamylcyclotransferase (GGCT)/AIG2-like uncharacterized protein YtfP
MGGPCPRHSSPQSSWQASKERLELSADERALVAVYGTLRRGLGLPDLPATVSSIIRDVGPCLIEGELYNLGEYPGLRLGRGEVVGELFEVADGHGAFALLDEYEGFDPADPDGSLYLRRRVRLLHPAVNAWVYVYNSEPPPEARIASGDWAHYVREQRQPS